MWRIGRATVDRSLPQVRFARPDVFRLRTNEMVLRVLLDHVGTPSCASAAGEHRHEGRGVQSDRLQYKCGVELDVCLEVASRLYLLEHPQHRLLDVAREIEQRAVAQH